MTGENEHHPSGEAELPGLSSERLKLTVTMDLVQGCFDFAWGYGGGEATGRAHIIPNGQDPARPRLDWWVEHGGQKTEGNCPSQPASIRAVFRQFRKLFPVSNDAVQIGILPDRDLAGLVGGKWYALKIGKGDRWKWLEWEILSCSRIQTTISMEHDGAPTDARTALHKLAYIGLGGDTPRQAARQGDGKRRLRLEVTFNQVEGLAEFTWRESPKNAITASGFVSCTGLDELTWEFHHHREVQTKVSSHTRDSIRKALQGWYEIFPVQPDAITGFWYYFDPDKGQPVLSPEAPFAPDQPPSVWIEDNLVQMAKVLREQLITPEAFLEGLEDLDFPDDDFARRRLRKLQKQEEELARRRETMARLAEERRVKEQRKAAQRAELARAAKAAAKAKEAPAPRPRPELPPLPVRVELAPLAFQETVFPLADLRNYFLLERAALWWVSNQSDDLLCLPHCRIERLEYQLRTALRVLGPLRGRALLSDEVGLGKTIEAGLVIKELLTRGMVKRFLVLTVPSLVDQWQEELSDKFSLSTVTTNESGARNDPENFWGSNAGIVASLHTLKQAAHLQVARQIHWDILVVDEAHYLRNRESQAWQAVNALPRQFLLLLTATPVQNSLEELYNLVTLLQPGQLPSPREFRARFLDPKAPRQPREPEELRRLIGQVMIRNTRANAGVQLPPRRAETVLFEPNEVEKSFWQRWETEFRGSLERLNASEASLWGRLLLQAAGSSPAAWRGALTKFPDRAAADGWREQAPLQSSWETKCQLIPPLTGGAGGVVIFTQFLETQAALAEYLRGAKVPVFVIHGGIPAPQRQPITEEFQSRGGALLLTHSGTEGRNLQFCHRLVNFDLPWNPMEIEQRIGRLHRLGQQHPVRIYNFVQTGTLQEHLIDILQEKLNLFELVVGETGLVLGERFSSDEFAEEILRRWRESEGRVGEALATLGDELAAARGQYAELKQLDEKLFAKDYEM